jgi:hypothetical protein
MSKTLMNAAALLVLLAGSGMVMAGPARLMRSGGHCSSGDGTVSCDCSGKCWADATSCGCFEGAR